MGLFTAQPAQRGSDSTLLYEMEGPVLLAGEERLLDVAQVAAEHAADRKGRLLPAGATDGTFEVQASSAEAGPALYVSSATLSSGALAMDNELCGHTECCGNVDPIMSPDPWRGFRGFSAPVNVYTRNTCTNAYGLVSGYEWSIDNINIASVTQMGMVDGLQIGDTSVNAFVDTWLGGLCQCGEVYYSTPAAAVDVIQPSVSCESVTRGGTVTCTASAEGLSFTTNTWKFTDSQSNVVNGTGTGATWSGVAVQSGTVSVNVHVGQTDYAASGTLTVNARNWSTSPASAGEVPNGTFFTLPVPPQPSGIDGGVGKSYENISYPASSGVVQISDNGPNKGYGYYPSQLSFSPTYQYEINPDLENTGSTFYTSQCGNYNITSNPTGFILGASLLAQTNRHEHGSSQSHYSEYVASIGGSNNPGSYYESRVAAPGYSPSAFDQATSDGLLVGSGQVCTSGVICNIKNDFQGEPPAVNQDPLGNYLGKINYAPYTSCQ